MFHLKIRAHPTPEKPTGFKPKINRESERRERLLHPLPPRSTGGGGEDRQRWLSHTFQNSAGRSALPLYLEPRLFRAGSIPPPLLQCRAFPPVDQLLDTRCAASLVLISTQTPCKAVFSLESGNRAQNRALEEVTGSHPKPQLDTQLLGAGTPTFFFLNIRGLEMMISRPVRSTCPKTGLNEAGNEGWGEADGCDRAAWLVLGASEGGTGSAVSSSCIHPPGQTPPRAAAWAPFWARAHTKQAMEDNTGQPCSLSSSGHGHRTEK